VGLISSKLQKFPISGNNILIC